jgi:hypothetical protein
MSLFSVDVQMFRAFRERATVDYRPLTMFYGYNQAGKSTMLRLLPLLADSIYESRGALNMTSDSLASPIFKELGHMSGGGGIPGSPILRLKKDSQGTSDLELQFGDEDGLIVNRLRLFKPGSKVMDVTWEKTEERRGNSSTARYQGELRGKDWDGNLKFDNLFPSMLPAETTELIEQLRQAFIPLQRLQWLRANRIRLDGLATSISRCCASDGSDIASAIPVHVRNQVLGSATEWLQQQDNLANSISIDAQQKFLVGTAGRVDLPLYLAGEGLRALLPILLCACWAENKDDYAPTMLAFEEPEAHLHPHLQAALFDRLIKTVESGVPVALETHSVYMLRTMQLAILNKQIPPDDVALYWVEQKNGQASLIKIDVQADGTLHNWRPDVFEKEQELAQQILERRWAMGSAN